MKKIISVLLCFAMLFTVGIAFANAAENDPLVIAVANDVHLNPSASTKPVVKHNSVSADFFHAGHAGQMPEESLAIASAFFDLVAEDESDFLFLPGDISDNGKSEEYLVMTAMLRNFEATSGKKVFVVPGNHDLWNSSVAEFKEAYYEFGYDEAIAQDTLSGSYVAELNDEYRLLAIDSTKPGQSPHGMTQERVDWIVAQCKQAKADGKKMIAMMHHNCIEHFVMAKTIHGTAIVEGDIALAEALATNGVKYIFTGHTHDTDIAAYTAADGSILYDVVTAALFSYPCPYRVVSFSDKVKFEMRTVNSVDTALLPPGITENALALAATDMTTYSKNCTWIGVRDTVTGAVKASSLKNLLKINKNEHPEMCAIIDKVADRIYYMFDLPLNIADVQEGEMSIEAYLGQYDITLPQTNYTDIFDIAIEIFQAHVVGDENFPGYSDEVVSMTRGLAAALHYALADVTTDEYQTVISYLLQMLNCDLNTDLVQLAATAATRMHGIELLITTAVMPLICEYTVDDAPADNNVTLPGYASEANVIVEKSFFEQIIDFFMSIFSALRTFFAHMFS